jgi:hypothetical protein
MKKIIVFLLCLGVSFYGYNQVDRPQKKDKKAFVDAFTQDTTKTKKQNGLNKRDNKPPIALYKIISVNRDTTFVDTTLTIKKDYRFNYLRKDDFELIPFSNVGQPYNKLAYDFKQTQLLPLFGAKARHFSYKEVADVFYYEVPTPLTELYFKTAFQQGQQLDALFTVNTSRQFNIAVGYKGVRSLGTYQHMLTSTGIFWASTNYQSKNKLYQLRAHFTAQEIKNEENGGLNANSLILFTQDDPEFRDRGRLDVNYEDAETLLRGNRFFIENEYALVKPDTASGTSLIIGNNLQYEIKRYGFKQDTPFEAYGVSYKTENLNKRTDLDYFETKLYTRFSNKTLGNITGFIGYTDFEYGYDSVLLLDNQFIPNKLSGNQILVGGSYAKNYKNFALSAQGNILVSGIFSGNFISGNAAYRLNKNTQINAGILAKSAAPTFNFLLHQSDYVNFNWQNNFKNIKTQVLNFELLADKIAAIKLDFTNIDKYTYFAIKPNDSTPSPTQYNGTINYLKIKAEKEFKYKNFALANTIMYQNVLQGTGVFNVPEFTTRNTLYFQDEWFKKALFLQTGVTVKYFSKYYMLAYQPVLGEMYLQNNQKIGGFPLIDVFFNAKVRQTRIYFKYENIGALFSNKKDYFSAPNYPYRDAVLRFGLVWNFFL